MKQSIEHASINWVAVQPLCKFVEDFIVRMMHGKFFVLVVSSVYANELMLLDRNT